MKCTLIVPFVTAVETLEFDGIPIVFLKSDFVKSTALSLAFSAKESLFKATFPEVNYYFDFDSATLTHINTSEKTFK